jgi:hypothetical protein
MALYRNLKHVYDNSNKVTDTGLCVSYHQEYNSEGLFYEISRFAKKQYKFIGMDKDTAYDCAAAKRTQYTREFSRVGIISGQSGVRPVNVTIKECPSDIVPQHQDGDIWSVSISVNEQDSVFAYSPPEDPATLFPAANARTYDEDAGLTSLAITEATRTGDELSISYETAIAGFVPGNLICRYKTSESTTTWTSLSCAPAGTGIVTAAPVPTSGELYVVLVYGSVESNVVVVE